MPPVAPEVAMAAPTLLPDYAGVDLAELLADEAGITMVVPASRPSVCCLDCSTPAMRVPS
jgi:hypothetical protein